MIATERLSTDVPSGPFGKWLRPIPLGVGGLVTTVVGAILTGSSAPCGQFHFAFQLSGNPKTLNSWLASCDVSVKSARHTLLWDFVFMAGYGLLFFAMWSHGRVPQLRSGRLRQLALCGVGAAIVDVFENLVSLAAVETDPTGAWAYRGPAAVPILIAALAWTKWTLLALGLIASSMRLLGWLLHRIDQAVPPRSMQQAVPPSSPGLPQPNSDDGGMGVCCSGGGIRSAAYSLGALRTFEEAGVMDRARWLTAVSGGGYAATAWTLLRATQTSADPQPNSASQVLDFLKQPVPGGSVGRHRFLRNGPGGLVRPALASILYILTNLGIVILGVFAVAWPVGWLIGSNAVQPRLRQGGATSELQLGMRAWGPGALLIGLGLLLLLLSVWVIESGRLRVLLQGGTALLVVGLSLELLLLVFPLAINEIGRGVKPSLAKLGLVSLTPLIGALTALAKLLRAPVLGKLSPKWMKFGGLLLVAVVFMIGGKFSTIAATGDGPLSGVGVWIASLCMLMVLLIPDFSNLSLHQVYRKRLRRSFGLRRTLRSPGSWVVEAPSEAEQPSWGALPNTNPELVLCCTRGRVGAAPGGLASESFTISRTSVRMGNTEIPTSTYVQHLTGARLVDHSVATWIATSGAAFASAMGRHNLGSTNALLAALNVDLGRWLPNPRVIPNLMMNNEISGRNEVFGRVRYPYMLRKILGQFGEDPFVFVTDGGHYDNLGLVELFRRRCSLILCIDASGDKVGSYNTLREAAELALLELPHTVSAFDLSGLDQLAMGRTGIPDRLAVTMTVTYHPVEGSSSQPTLGTVIFAQAQRSTSMPLGVKQFAASDRVFPHYPTGNQLLKDKQFEALVDLGTAAANEMLALIPPGLTG